MWGLAPRKQSRFGSDLDLGEVHDQLDALRGYVHTLSHSLGLGSRDPYERARDLAAEAAHDAEQAMKDNLAASLVLAVGLGVAIGYFIGRGGK